MSSDPTEHFTTSEQCIDYLEDRVLSIAAQDGHVMQVEHFWTPECLEAYRKAEAWWPTIAKGTFHEHKPLKWMLDSIADKYMPVQHTFMQLLELRWRKCCDWLRSIDVDVQYPNETKEERKSRKSREAMARSRARKAANLEAFGAAPAEEAKRLWGEYIAACQERKAAAKAAHDAHTPAVEAAKLAYERARP